MNAILVFSSVLAALVFILGVVILLRGKNQRTNIVFSLITLSAFLWTVSNIFVDTSYTSSAALFWSRTALLGPIFIASLFVIFVSIFPSGVLSLQKKLFYSLPILPFLPFIYTNSNISAVKFVNGTVQATPGVLFYFVLVYFAVFFGFGFWTLIQKYRKSYGLQRQQITYVFLGFFLTVGIATFTNLLLPLFGIQNVQSLGPASTFFLISFIGYAIIRHRLLDISIIIRRSIVYVFLIAFVAGSFAGVTFLSGRLFSEALGLGQFLTSGLVALLVVLLLDPLKNYISRVTDKIFFKAKIDYSTVLQKLSTTMAEKIEMDPLLEEVAHITKEELKVESVITIPKNKQGNFRARVNRPPHDMSLILKQDSELIKFLSTGEISVLDSLERKIEDTTNDRERKKLEKSKEDMKLAHAAIAAPIMRKGELTGVFFIGPKKSGDSFSLEELRLFKVLGPQLATALEKARLFEEVKAFTAQLQQRVESATKELRERNAYLVALQDVSAAITRTFDFDKVTQEITNAIADELGFVGGLMVFLDNDGRNVFPQAITQTKITERALKLLPTNFKEFKGDLYKENTLDHRVIREGKRRITTQLSDVISPPVPKLIVKGIQKLLGIKTLVLVPIFSEDKAVGAIDFALAKEEKDISAREFEIMQALADQTGIAYRNWRYVERIKEANRQLEDANERLMQLDQAKTEFVSIASHQLRTPMTGIAGYLSMLVGGDFGKLIPEHGKILKQLLEESQRMIRLINLFLNVSKIEAGKFELTFQPTQLEDVVEGEVKELIRLAAEKKLKLTFNKPKKKLPLVTADGDKLKDVILNLVDNGIKYTAEGSIVVDMAKVGNEVHVSVKDTGIGIEPDDAKHLFQKFVRASGIAQIHPDGSGLGLFIAKKIVEAHGGSIWVESKGQGKGSTFFFAIPIEKAKVLSAATTTKKI
ncbi:MAG: ATP-binding protein [Patescibacteria group bacterium]|jgi:signal transduction histidine kinase